MTLTRSMVVLALAAFSASVYAEPTYPNKHQKEVIPEAQQSDSQKKFEPEQDKGSQSSSEKVLSSLGLTVSPSDDGNGLAITDVDPDSDAAARGLKTGERITSVNNQQVASAADVEKILEQAKKDGRSKALFQIQTDDGSRFIALDIDQG